ncbi:hypothetical protein J6590_001811 [Homalodisca vitripennis]|nr:hypothetical protein J6590_100073 [Homalodisca vitripennis]KAG8313345.1 hypothetical protein J6590_001811 [Homalodisca vitripennis]
MFFDLVSASLATGSNNGQSSNSGGTRATDGGARATAGPSEQPEPQGPVTGAAEATAQPVTGPTAAANPPTITRTPGEDASGQTQTPSSQRTTRIGQSAAGGPGFEIFVDVAPGSITIDSVEATVLTNSNPNISEPSKCLGLCEE